MDFKKNKPTFVYELFYKFLRILIKTSYNIIYEQIKSSTKLTESYFEVIKQHSMSFVLWQLYFPKVFRDNGGFDIVIGNPPYVQLQVMHEEADKLQHIGFKTYERTGDIYCLFYEKGYNLLSKNGFLCFITSNKWMRANYGKSLRDFFVKNTNPVQLLDFAGNKIFENATVDVNILLFGKSENKRKTKACIADSNCRKNISDFFQQNKSEMDFKVGDSWVVLSPIEQSIKRKIEAVGTPLKNWDIQINYGIKTGYNDAFIISGEKKDELIKEDPKSADIIRPILRGRDIKRYGYDFADLWLLFIPWHFPLHNQNINGASLEAEEEFKKLYPAVYKHLLSHKEALSNRNKSETGIRYEWYALQRWGANYWGDFSKQKIIYPEIAMEADFFVDDGTFMTNQTCYIMITSYPYYLALTLSSKLFYFVYKRFFTTAELGKSGYRYMKIGIIELPVIPAENLPNETITKINSLYQQRVNSKEINAIKSVENEIDFLIYNLYGISEEEIEYINKS